MPNPRIKADVRHQTKERACFRCEYCLSPETYSPTKFSIEHILPLSRSGNNSPDNLALSCQECNNLKSVQTEAVDPSTNESVPLFHPRQHQWAEHFCWSEDKLTMLGLTPTGRATIERLHLNRIGVVNLRSLLLLAHKHPPPTERQ